MDAPTVYIVDDHAGVRDSIAELVDSVGLRHAVFASGQAFLDAYDPGARGCLVLDVRMAHMSGLELQQRLDALGARLPIVFISAHADIDVAVKALRAGALDFVTKPYRDQQLLDSINEALARDAVVRAPPGAANAFIARLATLSPRERQVADLVVAGKSSKAIARALGISHRTVEQHRGHVLAKLGLQSVADLVRLMVENRGA